MAIVDINNKTHGVNLMREPRENPLIDYIL